MPLIKRQKNVTDLKVFTGNANPELVRKIVDKLAIPLGDASVDQFSDGEISVKINENVRGGDVFVVQSTLERLQRLKIVAPVAEDVGHANQPVTLQLTDARADIRTGDRQQVDDLVCPQRLR